MIRLLLGLVRASAGRVRLFGEPPSRSTRRRLGAVPQTVGLYEDLTVRENLAFAAAAFGTEPTTLPRELKASPSELVRDLPLGLQRRLAFAQALAHRPELLMLDEPTSGVDPLGRARLWDSIRETAERGAGVLVSTHYMGEAEQCDRLVVMSAGRITTAGTIAEIIGDATAVEVRAAHWDAAFSALDQAGLAVALVGRTLRVPSTSLDHVRAILAAAAINADTREVPAPFEESFVTLSDHPSAR